MNATAPEEVQKRLQGYSLSELEDVLAYLDRDAFPERHALVSAEIERRLKLLDTAPQLLSEVLVEDCPPGFWRRISSSFVDVSIQVLVPFIVYYLLQKTILASPDTAAPRRRGRPQGIWGDITALYESTATFFSNVAAANPDAIMQLEVIGGGVLGYMAYRALWHVYGWTRSGSTLGMRELGLRLERVSGGRPSIGQAAARFFLHPILFVGTLGISGLWMLWDGERRALHDKMVGTKLVAMRRTWEKSAVERQFD